MGNKEKLSIEIENEKMQFLYKFSSTNKYTIALQYCQHSFANTHEQSHFIELAQWGVSNREKTIDCEYLTYFGPKQIKKLWKEIYKWDIMQLFSADATIKALESLLGLIYCLILTLIPKLQKFHFR